MTPPAGLYRGKAFDAARQHSRRVRLLRFAVPLIALCGVVAFVVFAFFDPFSIKGADITIHTTKIDGDKIVMELPHLTGFNKKQEAYNVTAATATQKVTSPGLIDLQTLEAVISMTDASKSTLTAALGKFDSGKEILDLNKDVKVRSTKGYSADLSVATIDFKAGTVNSDQPVVVYLANGTIRGGSLSIANGGSTINFKSGVTSRFQRAPAKGAATVSPSPSTQ